MIPDFDSLITDQIDLLFEYDNSIELPKNTGGHYSITLSKRGKTVYHHFTDDIRSTVRDFLNKLCFEVNEKLLFITLKSHIMGYIVICSKKLKYDYYLQITSGKGKVTANEVASYLKSNK